MVLRKKYIRDEDDTPTDIDEIIDISDDEEESGDEFIVEKIIDHRMKKGVMQYFLKWKGYPEEDNTWENESDVFAGDLIAKYWEINSKGDPKENIDKVQEKQTTITNNQVNLRKRKFSDSFIEEPDFSLLDDYPPPDLTNWEEAVDDVETVERNTEENDNGLLIYLNWKNGHRTRHPASVANLMCPQKIIRFYEEHLRFKDPEEE